MSDTISEQRDAQHTLLGAVLPHAARLLLVGPPATGKTTAAIRAATDLGNPVYILTCTPDLPTFEARGVNVIRDGSMAWLDGPATAARRAALGGQRVTLVIDEIDKAGGDLLAFLLAITAHDEAATLTLPTGEVVPYSPTFQCIATMNGSLDELPEPTLSRFPIRLTIDTTAPGALAALPEDVRAHAAATCDIPDKERRIDVRAWHAFCELRRHVPASVAARAVWNDRAPLILDAIAMSDAQE